MLVIISDLHLTDGTSGATISPGAFDLFAERLADLAVAASWRADGTYRPLDGLDLVLLGDVLDVIRSARWLDRDAPRPWDDPATPEFQQKVLAITQDILRHNESALAVLRGLASAAAVALPPVDGRGRPALGGQPLAVPIRIHYLVGNHDWFYHLRGPAFDAIRHVIVERMGLANRFDRPFMHDPAESTDLLDVLRRHKVFARHGDIYDPFNYEGDRSQSSLGDCIVVELLNRFAVQVAQELADDLPAATLLGLRELDNVRPVALMPVWIDGLLERTCPDAALKKQVKRVWDRLADRFLELPFVRQRDTWNPADLVDGLEKLLKFSKQISFGWASRLISWLHGLRGSQEESYLRHALTEQDFRNRRARHIVFGHTHYAETVPLDASFADSYALHQTYFNSGTWRRVHRQTALAPSEHEFLASDVMTYLAFFLGDERKGRPYETWSGTLGVGPMDVPAYRLDAGSASHAFREQVQAPGLHGRSPHFAASAAAGRIVPSRRVR